jgi:ADP-ribosylglycohydrolase
MLGSFIGDFVGSAYEHADLKGFNLPLVTSLSNFTDDSVMTAATIDSLLNKRNFSESLMSWCSPRRDAGFSETLKAFMDGEDVTYLESCGNGAAIRVAPIAYFAKDISQLFQMVEDNARVTHNSQDAIEGAQAISLAVFLKKKLYSNEDILKLVKKHFHYDLNIDIDDLHENHTFTTQASVTVPIAIYLALNSRSVENCLRKGLHIGGDVDSILSMACAIMMADKSNECPPEVFNKMISKAKINDPELLTVIEKIKDY